MFKLGEILTILNHCIYEVSERVKENLDLEIAKISTDTRKNCDNSLFVPLIGENFDGHDFIEKAFEKGAVASLTEKKIVLDKKLIIKVRECLFSIGEIAKAYLQRENIKTIAITGTSGKTTVKEMLAFLTNFPSPEKSFNNLIGVPLTILEKGVKDNFLILEFGTNLKGEISRLTEIGCPEYVIITNIGYAHLEGFKSFEEYVFEKLSILNSKNLKKAFVNVDNPIIFPLLQKYDFNKVIKFSVSQIENFKNDLKGSEYSLIIDGKNYKVKSKLYGIHNAVNFLGVLHLLNELNFNLNDAIEKFETFDSVEMRFQVLNNGFFTIINDCYNANFSSFTSALQTFNDFKTKGKKILVAGDMLELGSFSDELHKKLGKIINETDIDKVICIGNEIKSTYSEINNKPKKYFSSINDAFNYLKEIIESDDIILFKSSRKLKLERLIEDLMRLRRGN